MVGRIAATDDQIVFAVLCGIAMHPLVQNPSIYHPVDRNLDGTPKVVKITKLRAYAGTELFETSGGVTLSVYLTPRSSGTGVAHTIAWSPQSMSSNEPGEFLEKGTYNISVELRVFDPSFDIKKPVYINAVQPYRDYLSLGDQVDYTFDKKTNSYEYNEVLDEFAVNQLVLPPDEIKTYETDIDKSRYGISIIPAEEILKQYTTLIRHVIRDQKTFRPYNIRNPRLVTQDYNTVEILSPNKDDNLVFHQSRLGIQLEVFETNCARPMMPPVRVVNVS